MSCILNRAACLLSHFIWGFTVFALVVLDALVVVLEAVAEQAIDQTGQEVGHGGDGCRSV